MVSGVTVNTRVVLTILIADVLSSYPVASQECTRAWIALKHGAVDEIYLVVGGDDFLVAPLLTQASSAGFKWYVVAVHLLQLFNNRAVLLVCIVQTCHINRL